MKKLLALALLALLALAPFAFTVEGVSAEPLEILYRLDLTRAGDGLLAMELEVDCPSSPLVLEAADSFGEGLAVDLASHIEEVEALDASGRSLEIEKRGPVWYVDGTGRLTIRYEVDAASYRAGSDYLQSLADEPEPWPYFPLLEDDLAYLPGYAVFLTPREAVDYRPELELDLPSGWAEATPWREQPADLDEITNNPILAGDLVLEQQGSVLVALPSSSAAAAGAGLFEYASKAQTLLAEAERELGVSRSGEDGRLLVALLFRGETGGIEEAYYPSTPFSRSLVLPAPSQRDLLSDSSVEQTARAIASWLFAGAIDVEEEALWLREGAAWYFQVLLPYRAGIWGASTFWDRLSARYDVYREAYESYPGSIASSGADSFEDRDAAAVLCCGGASACAALDSYLYTQMPDERDLASVLRDIAVVGEDEGPLTNEELQAFLVNLTGRDWEFFFRDYIEGRVEIPVSSFSALNVAPSDPTSELPIEGDRPPPSTSDWIVLVLAVGAVFIIPFILEPYTMRPRKPGFLERLLKKED